MYRAFPGSEYYDGSVPSRTDRRSVHPAPPTRWPRTNRARSGTVPVFTEIRSSKEEPDYAPAASLRVRRRPFPAASRAAHANRPGSSPPVIQRAGTHRFQPTSTRFELASNQGTVTRRFLAYSSPTR